MRPSIRGFLARLLTLFRFSHAEREMEREIAAHLALAEEEFRRRGMPIDEARRAARRAVGGIERVKELHRDERSFPWLEDLRRDVPYAIRGLRRSRGFTVAAVLTIALGVGAAAAVFTIVNAILLRPLPYRDSDRLVQIAENIVRQTPDGPRSSRRFGLTQAEFLDWRERTTAFSQMAGVINLMNGSVQTAEGSVAAPRAIVSPALFEMLGVRAQMGRTLLAEDERPDADAAVISAAAWARFYGSDPAVLGRPVSLNGNTFTVVGVMPAGFDYPERSTMFWTALAPRSGGGNNPFGNVIATLAVGVSLAAAVDEANAIGPAVRAQPPPAGYGAGGAPPTPATATMGGQMRTALDLAGRPRFDVLSVKGLIVDAIRPQLRLLAAAVFIVWLIACGNVANLLLARGTAREREIGVRLALGAGRARIVRQIITESLILSLAGGVVAIGFALAAVKMATALATVSTPRLFQLSINLGDGSLLPRVGEIGVDASLIVSALAIAAAASIVCGLAPALYVSRADGIQAMHPGGLRLNRAQPGGSRARTALATAQVTLATALLIAAGLLIHSFIKLLTVDAGYDSRQVLTFQLAFPPQTPGERQVSVIEQLLARLQTDARVAAAGYTNVPPFIAVTEYSGLIVPPGSSREQMLDDPLRPQTRIVSHGYLQALGARLLEGRWLAEQDAGGQELVMVVNRALARRYFAGASAVGSPVRIFRSPAYSEQWRIVGVVDDVTQARLDQSAFPIAFVDPRQVLAARTRIPKEHQVGQALSGFPTIVVRARTPTDAIAAAVRGMVREIDRTVSVDSIADLDSLRYGSLVRPRFYAVLVGVFAGIAGLLAVVGVYGVLAYAVVQRTHEIGVRMALGAQRGAVLADVLRRGMSSALVGVIAGIAGAAAVTRYLSTMLYGLSPLDPVTLAAVAAAFIAVTAVACYIPARRATEVDPLIALRCE